MNMRWTSLIVALDADNRRDIERVISALNPCGVKFKIGSIAFTKFGPDFVKRCIARGSDIFLDLKLYDIPNTMKETAAVITEMGCWAFTVHAQAGREALCAVRAEVDLRARVHKIRKPLILGVTKLTSSHASAHAVLTLADTAAACGLDGVIASAKEAHAIKKKFGKSLRVVTPGIRSPQDDRQDQKRITTARAAFAAGADYIVVGRPIIAKKNHRDAARDILST
ncbi:MAG: orotidine-5'-phosphate decarboxylase [Candidatus Omnitrophota bacterium]|nr:orotidine-5'-phosphate decarboxylase [Candidatus Omnitrophota bacterium]